MPEKFGVRFFLHQSEVSRFLDSPNWKDELAAVFAKVADNMVYQAIEAHGLQNTTMTITKQERNVLAFQDEGWIFELRGEKP